MKLKASSYIRLTTDEDRAEYLLDYFARNAAALNRKRKGETQGIDPTCTFETYETSPDIPKQIKALKVCKRFADRLVERIVKDQNGGIGLLMQGEPGCGKTHLAHAILNSVASTFPGYYITAGDLFDFMRLRDEGENTFASRKQNLKAVSVLVVDEIGRSAVTDFERRVLRDIVEDRFALGLPTILISNLDGKELVEALDKTFTSRLNLMAYRLVFDWEDHRRLKSVMNADPETLF